MLNHFTLEYRESEKKWVGSTRNEMKKKHEVETTYVNS